MTPEEGIQNQLWAATAKDGEVVNGAFYEPVAVLGNHDKASNDANLATQLWEWTEKELEPYSLDGEHTEPADHNTTIGMWPMVGNGMANI